MTKAKILIVEDEPFVAQDLKIHLENAGYEVQGIVASGEGALASIAASRPNLVMMDIVLEGQMDGIQAAQEICSRYDLPVIYLTAYADDHFFQRAKVTEPFAYLLKPFNERELQLTIEIALYRHQMDGRLRESEVLLASERHQREIIAREGAEQALRESEERYQSIVNASPDAIIVLTNGSVAFANIAAAKLLGVENAEDLIGVKPEELVHPEYHMLMIQRTRAALINRSINPLVPFKMLRRDGTSVDVESVSFAFDYRGVSSLLVMVHDVSQRKKAEETLRRFRVALDSSPDSIFLIDREELRFIDVNETACICLGYTREALLGMGPHDIKPLFNKQMIAARFDELLDGSDHTGIIETFHKRKDNTLFPVEINVRALESEGRTIIVAIARDVSKRHESERFLRDSEEKFRQLAENIREVFWIRDEGSGQILYVSPAYEEVWGRTCESLIERPRSFLAAVHPEDRERVTDTFALHRVEGGAYDHEYRIIRPDGSIRWIWAHIFPIRDADGKIYRTAGMAEDITEHRAAEEALRESEERFRMLFEHAPVGFAIVGKNYKFAEANQALCAMLGYSLDELQNKTFGDVTFRDDLEIDLDLAKRLFNGEISSYKLGKRYVRKNGEVFWIDLIATVIHDEHGAPLYGLGIIQDITERMQAEAARHEREVAQRNTLVREVHHRIKNNLQGVVGLLRQHAAQHPKVKKELEAAIARINSIAMVYGLQSEDLQEQVRLCDMICGICSSAQLMMEATIEPIVEVDMIRPVKVTKEEAVPIALILNELIYNAIKHSKRDKDCQPIQVFMGGDDKVLQVRVQNRCASLPAGFDFSAGQGLGTGLSLVKSLLPHKGAQLDFFTESGMVIAKFVLMPPVIVNKVGIAGGICAS